MEKNLTIQNNQINLTLESKHLHELHQQGFTWSKLASIYKRSERTIYRWISPIIKPKQKEGRKPKVDERALEILLDYVKHNNTKTQQEMADYLSQQIGQKISRQTVGWWLKKNNYTHKKLTYQYAEQLPRMEEIKQFISKVRQIPNDQLLALDECSFHLNEDPRYGYSQKGSRAVSQRPNSKGDNYTLLLCIKNSKQGGIVHYELIEGGAKTQAFHDFLEEIDIYIDKKHYLLLDNASIHHAPDKRKELKLPSIGEQLAKKNIEAKYIVSYSPQLNPTELCFNFLRQQIEKSRPRNLEELKAYIDKTVEALNQKVLTKYFNHCFNYLKNNYAWR